jgi:hypothetical protein
LDRLAASVDQRVTAARAGLIPSVVAPMAAPQRRVRSAGITL